VGHIKFLFDDLITLTLQHPEGPPMVFF
jgi:hypothetical protein